MQIIRNLNDLDKTLQNTCLTLGNFDGIHLGHQKILKFTKDLAQKTNSKSALLTFEPHPRHFFNPTSNKNVRIYSLAQKLDILKKENLVDIVFLIQFNQELANLSPRNFVKNILTNQLKVKNLVVGYDFSFGKNRCGNSALLNELAPNHGYKFHQIKAKSDQNNHICSSTKIRDLLKDGDTKKASSILNRNYEIKGTVIKGQELGRKIGFKTANILPRSHIIKPKLGVYKTITTINNTNYDSITNFGIKPTFQGKTEIFENHIFNFNQDIYGHRIKIQLLNFIRDEQKFNSIEELKTQITIDCQQANQTNTTKQNHA
jgi:riboflavin kinase/FMN adenylyltransferase